MAHLDVGSYILYGAGEGPKGWAVRPLKWHAGGWVQNVVRQFGLYLDGRTGIFEGLLTLLREDRIGQTTGLPVVPPGAPPGI